MNEINRTSNRVVVFVRNSEIYNDSRSTKEIKWLLENGFVVKVISWNSNGKAAFENERVFLQNNIEFFYFDCFLNNGIGLKNIKFLFRWFRFIKSTLKRIGKIDFIHACDLDTAFCIKSFAKRNKIKYVYDIFDYYVDTHNVPLVAKKIVEKLEIAAINNAYVTIICTEERLEQIRKASPKRVEVVFNSPDLLLSNYDQKIKYDYAYCGGLVRKRMIDQILEHYGENSDLKFLFAGYGSEQIEKLAKDLDEKYENFEFVGQITYENVLKYENQALVLSAVYDPKVRNHQFCAPNKFYEALALGKPQIVCKNTGIDRIIDENNIGISIEYDVESFYSALRKLKNDETVSENSKIIGKKIYEEKYSWSKMKNVLANIYLLNEVNTK